MPYPTLGPRPPTNPLIWCIGIVCAILAITVIVTGVIVVVGYIIIRPKVPLISVTFAHLDMFGHDQAGLLTTQLTILVKVQNDNSKEHASFYDQSFVLSFHGLVLARLAAYPFDVRKNSSIVFNYVAQSSQVPLGSQEQDIVDLSIRKNHIRFDLKGSARTRWRVGFVGSVNFWLHLNCQLNFFANGSSIIGTQHCSTKSK